MASQGPLSPGTIISQPPGDISWADPGNAAASDDAYASIAGLAGNNAEVLKATNYGFTIPTGATIDSIVASIEKAESLAGTNTFDLEVRIVKGGTLGATSFPDAPEWPTTDAYTTYSNGLWGESWTHSDINSSGFGVGIIPLASGAGDVRVDHMRITVDYTVVEPAGVTSPDYSRFPKTRLKRGGADS